MTTKRPFSHGICLILVILTCAPVLFSYDRTIKQYIHTAWGDKEGAPSGILALAQTADGYLWIGSVDGLYRFDGVSFERYQPGLIYALFSRPNGDLWIGLNAAVTLLRNGKQTSYTVREGVPKGKVAGFAQDGEGTIWLATNAGLARFEGDYWTQVGRDWNFPGKIAMGMCLDRQGNFWVATESTIVFLPRGARRFQTTGISTGEVWIITEAPNGKLWMAETTRSVRPVPLGRNLPPSDKTEIVAGSIGILFDAGGVLWITEVGKGMRRVSHPEELGNQKYEDPNQVMETFTSKDGLTDDIVTAILQDREGNIWVGTNTGLDLFRKGVLAPFVSSFPIIQAVFGIGDAGDMWVSSNYNVLHILASGTSHAMVSNDLYLKAYRDPHGVIWWSGNGSISRLKNERFVRISFKTAKTPFRGSPLLTQDLDGVLWAAVDYEGIFYLKNDVWERFETPPEIARLQPGAAFTDWMGRVWFGFQGGGALVTLQEGKLNVLAASGKSPVGASVTSIQGRGRHIWIGGAKLVYFDGGNFHEVVPSDAAQFKVWGIEETSDGSLWLCENRGVVHIPSAEVRKFLDNPSYRVQYDLFDSEDGLPGSFHDAAARSREVQGTDGRLWFATTKGIAWLDPTSVSKNTLPPPVSIRSVNADGRQSEAPTDLVLPPRLTRLEIRYTALSLSVPARVRFRYKLEGVDKDWQDAGTRREAFYTNLRPGHYRFRVIACNNDGVWNDVGAAFGFSVSAAWFQTNWFLALCIVAGIFITWTLYRLHMRQVARALNARFDERLAERTRVARELHDTLLQTVQGSKMVADDALDQPGNPARMRRALEQLSLWLGQATQEGRAALNSLRASTVLKNDLGEAFRRAIEDCRRQGSIEPYFSVTGEAREMHPVVRDEVYRIGYEAIRNACMHSHASRLEVELGYSHDLTLRVADNGVGIDRVMADGEKEGHFGLQGMRERADRIGGNLTVTTSAGSGTEIKVAVPGGIIFRNPSSTLFNKMRAIFHRQARG